MDNFLTFFKNPKNILIFFFIILLGSTVRLYNLNFENFWIDEMLTFWVADPNITIKETMLRNIDGDLHFLFNYILKFYFFIFSYDVNLARFLPAAIGIFSILSFFYLSFLLNEKRCLLLIFLVSANIFLINYSQELRSYSLLFFLTSISLIFFFRFAM